MKSWCNFHTHGTYSMLDGLSNYHDLVDRAIEINMPTVGITEHGNVHGWLDFYDACKKNKDGDAREQTIKPALGIELYQARKTRFDKDEEERASGRSDNLDQHGPYHLGAIAQNLAGYNNIIKLSSRAYTEGYYVKARVDLDLLAEHSEGVILFSGCLNGMVQQALLRNDYRAALYAAGTLQDIVGKSNFFIEIQDHGLDEQHQVKEDLLRIAASIDAKVVATGDCHYVHKADSDTHDLLLCLATNATVDQEVRFRFKPEEFYLKSYEEMSQRIPTEYLDNSLVVADMIDVNLEFNEFHFPKFDVPEQRNPETYLEDESYKGLIARYGEDISEEIAQRWLYEMDAIKRMGFCDYFLVVADIVNWAKNNGIRVGVGRGSAAGSIVSYAMRITNIDPMQYGLLFERFLVDGRRSMPDVDLDIDDRYRDKVIDYVKLKYGNDRVANVVTFGTIGARSGVKDAARVLGYDYALGDKISKMIPPPAQGFYMDLSESVNSSSGLRELYEKDADVRRIVDAAKGLEGSVRQTGVHAAAVIIAPGPITDYAPVMQKTDKKGELGPVVTQWDGARMDQIGLLKIDFLGLRNLSIVDECVSNIYKTKNIKLDIDSLPTDDWATYKTLQDGYTKGVFQLESPKITELTQNVKPNTIEDIMAIISLFRPGPLGSHMDKMYIERKHGREAMSYPHPLLKTALSRGYGLMIYQEDILAVANILAGFSPIERDDLRKAVGKKLKEKIAKIRKSFVAGCVATVDMSEAQANKIFTEIEFFGAYGFNRCVVGDTTFVNRPSENQFDTKLSVKDMYNRLHKRGPYVHPRKVQAFYGPCISCGKKDDTKYIREQCRACYAWRQKFLYQRVYALSLDEETKRIHPNKIKDIYYQGFQDAYRLVTLSGKTLDVTANHRSLTSRGWLMTQEIKIGDTLIVDGGYETPTVAEAANRTRLTVGNRQLVGTVNHAYGANNYGFVDGGSTLHKQFKYQTNDVCIKCETGEDIQISHIDGNHQNNNHTNLQKMCRSCHLKFDYNNNNRKLRWEKGHLSSESEVIDIIYLGKQETYDVEMEAPHHNFLANGIVTHNSHAGSYAILGYWTAYLKTHYPAEYMAALITSLKDMDKSSIYVEECKRMGIAVLPPSISQSSKEFKVLSEEEILFGFKSVNGIGGATLDRLDVTDRDYDNIYDWLRKMDSGALNKGTIEHLLYAGALDELAPEQPDYLFGREEKIQLLNAEFKELGAFITEHPLAGIWNSIEDRITHTIEDLINGSPGQDAKIAGLVTSVEKKTTKRNQQMIVLNLQDLTGSTEIVLFPKNAESHKDTFTVGDIVVIKGRINIEGDEDNPVVRFVFTAVEPIMLPEHSVGVPMILTFDSAPSDDIIDRIDRLIEANPGDSYIYLNFPDAGHHMSLKFKKPTSRHILEQLNILTMKDNV